MNHDRLVRMCYAIVYADRRVDDTDETAARRAAECIGDVEPERVLELARIEREKRISESRLTRRVRLAR